MTARLQDWLQGSFPAIVTPMEDNGDLDFQALDALIDWHVEKGPQALWSLGRRGSLLR